MENCRPELTPLLFPLAGIRILTKQKNTRRTKEYKTETLLKFYLFVVYLFCILPYAAALLVVEVVKKKQNKKRMKPALKDAAFLELLQWETAPV